MRPDTYRTGSVSVSITPAGRRPRGRVLPGLAAALGLLLAGTAGTAISTSPAQAQQMQRIAAVVNDQVISLYDLQARMEIAIRSSQLPDTQETRQRLMPNVLQQLVDERLKMQEAERLRITVTDEEVRNAHRQIERNNNMPQGALNQFLAQPGIDENAFNAQIRSEIAWVKVAQNELRRSVTVEPEEIDAVLEQLRQNAGKPERLLAEIVLPVDAPEMEEQIRSLADRLRAELMQGAPFPAVARQFSASHAAAAGGDLGWVVEGSLDPTIESVIATLQPGELSQPVRTASGYHLILLRERRDPKSVPPDQVPMALAQLYMPLSGPAAVPAERRQELAQKLAQGATCADIDRIATEMKLPSSGQIGVLRGVDLPPPVRDAVIGLEENRLSQPVRLGQQAEVLLMVCERQSPDALPPREVIEERLGTEKLERVAQRTLRNLRRSALIDVRL